MSTGNRGHSLHVALAGCHCPFPVPSYLLFISASLGLWVGWVQRGSPRKCPQEAGEAGQARFSAFPGKGHSSELGSSLSALTSFSPEEGRCEQREAVASFPFCAVIPRFLFHCSRGAHVSSRALPEEFLFMDRCLTVGFCWRTVAGVFHSSFWQHHSLACINLGSPERYEWGENVRKQWMNPFLAW